MTTISYDLSHLEGVDASRKALADARATLQTIEQGKAAAAERLSNVESKHSCHDDAPEVARLLGDCYP